MKIKEIFLFFVKFFKDCWAYCIGVWGFFGVGSLFDIYNIYNINIIDWNTLLIVIFYTFLIIHPFVIYYFIFYEKKITIIFDHHVNNNQNLAKFLISHFTETFSLFKIKIEKKIRNYYLFFSKFNEIETTMSFQNNNDFKLIRKKNKEYWITKCRSRSEGIYFIEMTSYNKTNNSFTKIFEIYCSKKKNIEKALKRKKKIYNKEIFCI